MKKDNKKEVVENYLKGEILVVIDAANLEKIIERKKESPPFSAGS